VGEFCEQLPFTREKSQRLGARQTLHQLKRGSLCEVAIDTFNEVHAAHATMAYLRTDLPDAHSVAGCQRRYDIKSFASSGISMAYMQTIRKPSRSTLNHVALTCIDAALRRYLNDQGVSLNQPIIIQMPVNLRREGEKIVGNKIGIILVELSPPTDDRYVRLRNIGVSLCNVRTMIDNVAPEAIESCTLSPG
jgi:hypothetical protein